jgi:hypothetical protein
MYAMFVAAGAMWCATAFSTMRNVGGWSGASYIEAGKAALHRDSLVRQVRAVSEIEDRIWDAAFFHELMKDVGEDTPMFKVLPQDAQRLVRYLAERPASQWPPYAARELRHQPWFTDAWAGSGLQGLAHFPRPHLWDTVPYMDAYVHMPADMIRTPLTEDFMIMLEASFADCKRGYHGGALVTAERYKAVGAVFDAWRARLTEEIGRGSAAPP